MNFDDPRLTAYALGELESAEDRASVEALLRDHPEVAAEVEATRAMAHLLRRELHTEPTEVLTNAQRNEVFAAALASTSANGTQISSFDEPHVTTSPLPWFRRHWVPSAIAATVVLGSTIALLWDVRRVAPAGSPVAEQRVEEEKPQLLVHTPAATTMPENQPAAIAVPVLGAGVPVAPPAQDSRRRIRVINSKDEASHPSSAKPLAPSPVEQQAEASALRIALAPAAPPATSPALKLEASVARENKEPRFKRSISKTLFADSDSADSRARSELGLPLTLLPQDESIVVTRGVLGGQTEPSNTESYDNITDNAFLTVKENPLSTFSIDVDTASYANVRRFLTNNQRPPKGAVRIEELINYFPYSYPEPQSTDPFSCTMEVATCPWTPQHRLVRVGLKGREIGKEKLPPSNLVFLIDVSGSMHSANKLPLVKECMQQLVSELREQDSVGIVVYAGSSGTVLESTSDKAAIRAALERLQAGGSTNGSSGLQDAYDLAQRSFKKAGNNRVILCTDGDFNVGVTSQSELVDLIQREAKSGVFLSVLGFGMGNTKDSTMEKLADKGNGNYAYIDSLKEGRKVLVEQMAGTLFTIAKDVKIQVEFNPAKVGAYRLIGYENRLLAKEDFNDDTKDAGEIGAGHTVTALYEVVPTGVQLPTNATVDPLKYQPTQPQSATSSESQKGRTETATEMLTLKLRFKQPDGDKSALREFPLTDSGAGWEKSSADFRWSAAVASFGMLLRDSSHRGNTTWDIVAQLANEGKGSDDKGYRTEFIQLIDRARQLVPVTPLPSITEQPKDTEVTRSNASSLVLPEFEVTDAPILDAIDTLSEKSREVDPNKKGVSVVFAGGTSGAQTKVSLRMRNTSVFDTAKAMATAAGLTLQEQGEVLILKAAGGSGK